MSRNLSELSFRLGLENGLFARLGRLADRRPAATAEDYAALGEETHVGTATVFGAVSAYDLGSAPPRAQVCDGSACRLAGTQEPLRRALEERLPGEVGRMACLGRCHENRAFRLDGRTYSGPDADRLETWLAHPREDHAPTDRGRYAVDATGPAFLTAPTGDAAAFYRPLLELLAAPDGEGARDRALAAVQRSGIRGRGGAGFPLATKLRAVREAAGDPRYVVVNADEGDPGAYTDRWLLEERPHRVLFGALLAAFITGARHVVVYVRAEYPEAMAATERAFAEAAALGLGGPHDDSRPFQMHLARARGAYICGEESALLASLEGLRPEVRTRPPYPATSGLFGRPTLVNNVETLAALPAILADGGEAFAGTGTPDSTGTKLLSLDGHFHRPGVYEVPMGTPLLTVLEDLGGGFREPVKALHIGGPLGGIVPVSHVERLTVSFEAFAREGFLLGHASVLAIPEHYPMRAYLEHLFQFTAHESCGKCFPCRIGSVRGRELLAGAAAGRPIDAALFEDLLDTLERGSLCGLGGGLPLPVRNALEHFADELAPCFATAPTPAP
jgi:NADH-quinone oxidoreductase subunit F